MQKGGSFLNLSLTIWVTSAEVVNIPIVENVVSTFGVFTETKSCCGEACVSAIKLKCLVV